jgi:hypothetical protein
MLRDTEDCLCDDLQELLAPVMGRYLGRVVWPGMFQGAMNWQKFVGA